MFNTRTKYYQLQPLTSYQQEIVEGYVFGVPCRLSYRQKIGKKVAYIFVLYVEEIFFPDSVFNFLLPFSKPVSFTNRFLLRSLIHHHHQQTNMDYLILQCYEMI